MNDFEFDLFEEPNESDLIGETRSRVVGWRLFNLEERQRAAETAWVEGFEASYGISLDHYLEAWLDEASKPRRSVQLAYKYLAPRLSKNGAKLTSGQCRQIIERLQRRTHRWRLPSMLAEMLPEREDAE